MSFSANRSSGMLAHADFFKVVDARNPLQRLREQALSSLESRGSRAGKFMALGPDALPHIKYEQNLVSRADIRLCMLDDLTPILQGCTTREFLDVITSVNGVSKTLTAEQATALRMVKWHYGPSAFRDDQFLFVEPNSLASQILRAPYSMSAGLVKVTDGSTAVDLFVSDSGFTSSASILASLLIQTERSRLLSGWNAVRREESRGVQGLYYALVNGRSASKAADAANSIMLGHPEFDQEFNDAIIPYRHYDPEIGRGAKEVAGWLMANHMAERDLYSGFVSRFGEEYALDFINSGDAVHLYRAFQGNDRFLLGLMGSFVPGLENGWYNIELAFAAKGLKAPAFLAAAEEYLPRPESTEDDFLGLLEFQYANCAYQFGPERAGRRNTSLRLRQLADEELITKDLHINQMSAMLKWVFNRCIWEASKYVADQIGATGPMDAASSKRSFYRRLRMEFEKAQIFDPELWESTFEVTEGQDPEI